MRILTTLAAIVAAASPAGAAQTPVSSFGANPGALKMYEYVPAGLPAGSPLVVVLHGCTQTAAAMENAGWDALADQYHFAVLYPEQQSANNPVECFNWAGEYGDLADLTRGQGENQSIMSMIDTEIATHGVDKSRVYIVGFSAGAAFTAVMLSTWPDRFAAGAIMSGLPYKCATDVSGAYTCQNPGVTKTAAAWGDLVRGADSFTGARPRVQIWHGTSDTTVAPANEAELIKQWTDVLGASATADTTETIGQATKTTYKAGGAVVVEAYAVKGMSHAVAIGTDPDGTCPSKAASYFEDHSICATLRAAKFFGVVPGGGGGGGGGGSDTTPPSVALVSPADGTTVSGAVTVVVAATDDVGVASVDLTIDGADAGTGTTAPYQFAWSATEPGSHTLVATATDAAGNVASAMATVTVPGAGGSGSNAQSDANADLPACSLDAGRGPRGFAPIALAIAFVLRSRSRARRRRSPDRA